MKPITMEQWQERFELAEEFEMPIEIEEDEGEGCTFYDNGSVKNADGDFIIKSDWVSEK